MRHYLLSILMCCGVMLMACSSQSANDGRAVSERLLLTAQADSVFVDSTFAKLDTMVSPEIFGRDFAMTVVRMAESDTVINSVEMNHRIQLLRKVYAARSDERGYKRFAEGVQSYINGLPIERQMFIYARVATPAQLGTALRIDRFRNPSDTARISQQFSMLRNIYSDAEWDEFMEFYNRQ